MHESGARTEGKGPRLVLVRGILKVQAKSQRIIGMKFLIIRILPRRSSRHKSCEKLESNLKILSMFQGETVSARERDPRCT